jgi:hypothetical protein
MTEFTLIKDEIFKFCETNYSKKNKKLNTFQHYRSVVVLKSIKSQTGLQLFVYVHRLGI